MPGRSDPLPVEAVRDLLGIVRALYRAGLEHRGHPITLEALRGIGTDLAEALELATRCQPDTLGHVAAWTKAERAAKALGELVDAAMPLKPAVDAALVRMRAPQRRSGTGEGPREPSRETRKRRG